MALLVTVYSMAETVSRRRREETRKKMILLEAMVVMKLSFGSLAGLYNDKLLTGFAMWPTKERRLKGDKRIIYLFLMWGLKNFFFFFCLLLNFLNKTSLNIRFGN